MQLSNTEASVTTSFGLFKRVVESVQPHCVRAERRRNFSDRRFEGVLFCDRYVAATDGTSAAVWFANDAASNDSAWSHHGGAVLLDSAQLTGAINHVGKLLKSAYPGKSKQHLIDSTPITLTTNGPLFLLAAGDFTSNGHVIRDAGFPDEALTTYFAPPVDEDAPIKAPVHWMPSMFAKIGESFDCYADGRSAAFTMTFMRPTTAARFEVSDHAGRLLVVAMPARG